MRTLLATSLFVALAVHAAEYTPAQLEGVGIDEQLGRFVDMGLQFTGEDGYPHTLEEYFKKGKPVILNLAYYQCPMLCNLVLNGQTAALREIPWTPGNEFEIVTISINPQETFDMARKKKAAYLAQYDRPAPGWHFLTDLNGNAARLANQVGFKYRYDGVREQYAHAAAIMVLAPDGKVSRYLYGVRFKARDLRLALTEASEGKVGTAVDRFLLYCFHYDPQAQSYVLFARNLMRIAGALIVIVMAFALWWLFREDRRRGLGPSIESGLGVAR